MAWRFWNVSGIPDRSGLSNGRFMTGGEARAPHKPGPAQTKINAALVLIFAVTELARAAPAADARFQQFDKNGDGEIAAEELGMPAAFDAADTDGNAFVSPEEFAAFMEKWRGGSKDQAKTASVRPARVELPESVVVRRDLRYCEMPGVEAKFHSLDVYAPKAAKNAPVIIFIHGGGWRRGDKSSPGVGSQPAAQFCAEGFVFVSINYRLTPVGKHPANIQDVAKAVAWVHDHIAEHGGEPSQINIMGHSAGAHLAALVAADERWLKAEGKSPSILKRATLLDTAAYDIPRYMKEFASGREGAGMRLLYTNAFGDTEQQWCDASPQAHLAPDKHIPPMLMFYSGSRMAANTLAPAFAEALTKVGAPSRAVDTVILSHNEIGTKAADKDHPLGQLVLRFLKGEDATTFPARLDFQQVVKQDKTDRTSGGERKPAPEPTIKD